MMHRQGAHRHRKVGEGQLDTGATYQGETITGAGNTQGQEVNLKEEGEVRDTKIKQTERKHDLVFEADTSLLTFFLLWFEVV